ncbi:AbgT family transporter [Trueperella bialowiezensis]|uniref:Aminobenzoyl-glutamate transport protein n=1 Tax=Trueperella bialowiezensis TaxID=312285 RepID=A0A3S4V9V7_9ACTO|nr:AbgT family transporter [Trueperella bialowiezensis]VEI12812.1 Aminobenzoyl-glutamate transport protein [Trueperella bialowiezensis]
MSQQSKTAPRKGLLNRFLNFVEWSGNKLPDPIVIFFLLCVGVLGLSAVAGLANWSAVHPGTGEIITAVNLLSTDGMRLVIGESTKNFGAFPPLGMVLIVMLGIGVAERSGWFEVALQNAATSAPKVLIIPSIAFIGLLGNIAGDAAPIVLPPLAAMIFLKMGWHPVAGIALGYASATGGFAANLMIGMSDALVQGFTQPAAEMIDPTITTNVAMNWYFIAASVFVLLPVFWFVTSKITIPRLGVYNPADGDDVGSSSVEINAAQRSGNRWAFVSIAVMAVILVALCIPENSFMRNAETGSLTTNSPLMNGIALLLAIFFFVPGLIYGIKAGTIKKSSDATRMMTESMAQMASFIVIVFFASQMLAYITASNMGAILAVHGANLLKGQHGIVLILGIIIISSFINIFIGSASAKWAILAPIFVPMMMLLDYHPAFTQMIYRIGDGITNPITPMFPYFALVLAVAQRYVKKIGMGTFIATLLPYSIAVGVVWTAMMIVWYLLGLPLGPGGPIYL